MNQADQVRMFLSMFVVQVPTLIVCLVAGIVILTRWKQASGGALWALLGFGLVLGLCLVMPLVQTAVIQNHDNAYRGWALSVLGIISSVLHAVAYAFLLAAVFAGRPAPPSSVPTA